MSNMIRLWLAAGMAALVMLGMAFAFTNAVQSTPFSLMPSSPPGAAPPVQISKLYAHQPLSFEYNDGQTDDRVKFLSRGPGYALFLAPTEAVFSLKPQRSAGTGAGKATKERSAPVVVRMAVVGGNPDARIEGLAPQAGKSHYLKGNDPAKWHRDVAHFGKVRYAQVYPGVDLVYYGNQRTLEYDFVVAPGADPARIAVAFEGIDGMKLDANGDLLLATAHGDLVQHKPVVYQQIDGTRHPIEGRYELLAGNRVAFQVGDFDHGRELVIDPEMVYSTYLGGNSWDYGYSIAVDDAGNAYVAGSTWSSNFPIAAAMQPYRNGAADSGEAFVTKLNALGELVYSTYLGGNANDQAVGIKLTDDGSVVIVGTTFSSDFPAVNAVQPAFAGGGDIFLAKLNPAGSALTLSTFLGGALSDQARDVSLDQAGNIYLVGDTASVDFPTKNPLQATSTVANGYSDAVIAKFNASGGLVYSTYLGGSGGEQAGGVAIDATGAAYIVGSTGSTDFPVTARRLQNYGGGVYDAFVSKINAAGTALVYSTVLGGEAGDLGGDIAVDSAGRAHVTGSTYSSAFPAVRSLDGRTFSLADVSGGLAFVTTLNATGDDIVFSTPVGNRAGNAITLDSAGNAYVTGGYYLGSEEVFVAKMNPVAGTGEYDLDIGPGVGRGIAIDGVGNVYLTGNTNSGQFPVAHAFQPAFQGGDDGFVVKLGNVAPGDFNADGRSDVVWRHAVTGANTIWGSANKATSLAMTDISDANWKIVAIANFDADLSADVLWRNSATGANSIWYAASFAKRHNLATVKDQAWRVVGTGDFNADGHDDIVWHHDTTGSTSIWFPDGSTPTQSLKRVSNVAWKIVGVGDFNGDQVADILWRNSSTGEDVIWDSGASYKAHNITRISNLAWKVVGVEDFNNDGVSDLLWRNSSTGANVIWLAASNATQQPVTGVSNLAWDVEGTGDYDGDSVADILWHNHTTGAGVVWRSTTSNRTMAVASVPDTAWRIVP